MIYCMNDTQFFELQALTYPLLDLDMYSRSVTVFESSV